MDKRKKREGQIGEKVAGDALEASRPLLHSQQHTPRALQSDDRDQRPSQRNSTPRRRKHRLRGAKTTTTPAKLSIAVPQSGEEGGDDGKEKVERAFEKSLREDCKPKWGGRRGRKTHF
jgi:hypothetical protein